jgi:hypothetical protein
MIAASIRNTNLFDKEEVPVLRGGFFFLAKHAFRRLVSSFNVECPTPIEEGRLGKIRAKHYSLLGLKSKKLKLE